MSVIRVNHTDNYTVMSNYHLRDKRLSLKAKGMLSQMLSLPPDWDYTVAGFSAINQESQAVISNTLKELKQYGYLIVTKLMPNETKSGRIEYIYDIYEQPQTKQEVEKQGIENQGVELQVVENRGQLNKDIPIKKEKINKDKLNTKGTIEEFTENADLKSALYDFIQMRKTIKKPMTDRAITLFLGKLKELSTDESTQIKIIEQSIIHNWQTVYPLKEEPKKQEAKPPVRDENYVDLDDVF